MKLLLCVVILIAACGSTVLADVARPKPADQPPPKVILRTTLEIVPETNASYTRLQISQSQLQSLRAALDGAADNTTVAASIAQSPGRTIVAGVLLFLSVSFAGVWLARSRGVASFGRTQKAVAALILIAAVVGAATIITRGNAGPPPGYLQWKNLSKNLSENRATSGSILVEVVADDPDKPRSMKLVIPVAPKQSGDE